MECPDFTNIFPGQLRRWIRFSAVMRRRVRTVVMDVALPAERHEIIRADAALAVTESPVPRVAAAALTRI
jgi:hypothetical protein